MPYLVNTSFHILTQMEGEFIRWVKEEYIPAVGKVAGFSRTLFCRLLVEVEEGASSFAVQFVSDTLARAEAWHDKEGVMLKSRFTPQEMLHFTTFMEII